MYALVRRRTLPLVAVGIALIVLLFGSGFENLFWGIQIGFVGATALGLGALLLLDDVPTLPGPGRAVAATGLLTVGVMTSGYGLFMLGLVGLDVLLDPRRRRWILLLLVPAALYGLWYVTMGRSGIATYGNPFTAETMTALPGFILDGVATAFGAAAGGGALVGRVVIVGARRLGRLPRRPPALHPAACHRLPPRDRRRVHHRRRRPGAARRRRLAVHPVRLPVRDPGPHRGRQPDRATGHPGRAPAAGGRRGGRDRGVLAGLERVPAARRPRRCTPSART